jgi:hypothetical protein
VEYLFVIWEGGDDAEPTTRDDALVAMGNYAMDLLATGKLKGGGPLFSSSEGATVRKRRGVVTSTDGPYIETKEVIGGFLIVEADSLDDAVELAKQAPAAAYGAVEVRGMVPMG